MAAPNIFPFCVLCMCVCCVCVYVVCVCVCTCVRCVCVYVVCVCGVLCGVCTYAFKLECHYRIHTFDNNLSYNSLPPPPLPDVPESTDGGEETLGSWETDQSDACASQE